MRKKYVCPNQIFKNMVFKDDMCIPIDISAPFPNQHHAGDNGSNTWVLGIHYHLAVDTINYTCDRQFHTCVTDLIEVRCIPGQYKLRQRVPVNCHVNNCNHTYNNEGPHFKDISVALSTLRCGLGSQGVVLSRVYMGWVFLWGHNSVCDSTVNNLFISSAFIYSLLHHDCHQQTSACCSENR